MPFSTKEKRAEYMKKYNKEYRDKNKDKLKAKDKKYHEENKDKEKEYRENNKEKKTEYDKRLDFFLHKDIGYDIVDPLVNGLFVDAYAATSLREYFATGFEDYYLNNGEFIKNMNPVLYRAINNLNDLE